MRFLLGGASETSLSSQFTQLIQSCSGTDRASESTRGLPAASFGGRRTVDASGIDSGLHTLVAFAKSSWKRPQAAPPSGLLQLGRSLHQAVVIDATRASEAPVANDSPVETPPPPSNERPCIGLLVRTEQPDLDQSARELSICTPVRRSSLIRSANSKSRSNKPLRGEARTRNGCSCTTVIGNRRRAANARDSSTRFALPPRETRKERKELCAWGKATGSLSPNADLSAVQKCMQPAGERRRCKRTASGC